MSGGDKPVLTARIKRLEEYIQKMGQEFSEILSTALENEGIDVYLGTFAA